MNILGILSLLLCAISVISADYCLTYPVAEGSPFTITQTVDKSDVLGGVFTWKYTNAVGVTLLAMMCDIKNKPPCPSTFLYTGTMATSGKTKLYNVTLTVKSMSRLRDQGTWSWHGSGDDSIEECNLPVYSLQSDPECDENIQLSSDGKNVLWNCIVDNVYPEMDCQFQHRKGTSGNFMSVSSGHITSNKVTTNGNYPPRSVYHTYTCVMILPISGLTGAGAGSYQFMLHGAVRVDVKGGTKTEFKDSGLKTLTLALPQVELVDCHNPQEYIKEGDTKKCGCRIKTQGTPPGQPVWRGSNVNLVGNDGSNGVKYLSLKYNSQDQNPTYNCRGVSPLGSGPDVSYTPKFAYGPSQISMSFNSNNEVIDSINKCEETTSFTTYCDIAMANVNPKPTMMVTSSDGSPITTQQESTVSKFYRYKNKVVPKGGGIPTITCQATNAIFSDLTTTESKTITVQEPPPSAPVMTATISNKKQTVENGGTVTVTSGDTVQVKCRVDGGFPGVSKVTTVCAGVTNVNNGIEATQTVKATKENNNKKCSCEADHVTGCYHETSEFTLNVQYTPSVTGYKANSESQKLTVSADETVKFVCDVEGNPTPSVSVKGQSSGGIVTLSNTPFGSYGQRSTGSKVMSCQDTDEYRCVADNGVGDGVVRTVSVFVECVPELPSDFHETVKEFKPINGTDLEVIIPIIGYPEPKEYTLTKVGNQNRRRRRAATEVDERLYNVTYTSDQSPKGKVVLTMFGLTSSDSGKYVLNIDNGIGDGFDYSFNVTIAAENNDNGEEDSSIVPIIAGIVAALVVIGIIVIAVIGFKKWRGKQDKKARDKQRMAALDDKPTMRINDIYAGTNNGDDNDEGSERDSDFVEFDNVIYGSNNGVTNDPVAPVYTDYNSIVPTITTATARPKNLSAYSDVNLDENPYEDTDLTNTPIASKPAPPKKPTPALKPSSPATTDVTHKVTPADEVDDVNLYSAVNLETKSTQKKQPVVELVETEDAYGFPLRKSIPVIPEKNFVDGDGSGGASGGGDHGASVKKQKQKPQVPSKKGQMPKNNNNNNANSNHRHSKNNQAYNNMALVLDKDGAARIAVGSEDGTYFNNSNIVDNVYGNTPVPGGTDDDNVYGNAAVC